MSNEISQGFVICFVVILVLFFILRELWCWYFKSNKIIAKLEKIESKLNSIENNIRHSYSIEKQLNDNMQQGSQRPKEIVETRFQPPKL